MYKISKERLDDYIKLLNDMTMVHRLIEESHDEGEVKEKRKMLFDMVVTLSNSMSGFKLLEEKGLDELEKGMEYDAFPGSNYLDNERFMFLEGYINDLEGK